MLVRITVRNEILPTRLTDYGEVESSTNEIHKVTELGQTSRNKNKIENTKRLRKR